MLSNLQFMPLKMKGIAFYKKMYFIFDQIYKQKQNDNNNG